MHLIRNDIWPFMARFLTRLLIYPTLLFSGQNDRLKTFLGNATFQLGMLEMLTTAMYKKFSSYKKECNLIYLKQLSTLKITHEESQ